MKKFFGIEISFLTICLPTHFSLDKIRKNNRDHRSQIGCSQRRVSIKIFSQVNWHNSSWDRNPLGIIRPGLIPGSEDDIPKEYFTNLSEFGKITVNKCNLDKKDLLVAS